MVDSTDRDEGGVVERIPPELEGERAGDAPAPDPAAPGAPKAQAPRFTYGDVHLVGTVAEQLRASAAAIAGKGDIRKAPPKVRGTVEALHRQARQLVGLADRLNNAVKEGAAARYPDLVEGYDATFWHQSYGFARDAVLEHSGDHVHEDDCAEEGIIVDSIERAGARLKELTEFLREMADVDGWSAGDMQRRAHELLYEDERETKEGVATPAEDVIRETDAERLLREFAGYLCGAIPELHAVEVPRLGEAAEAFLAARATQEESAAEVPRG